MEELFFATSPIWWGQSFMQTLFIIGGCFLFVLFVSYTPRVWNNLIRKRQKLQLKTTIKKEITSLEQDEKNWEQKAIQLFKKLIAYGYQHHNPPSDTAKEIDIYIKERNIANIIQDIEKNEYQGKELPYDERRKIEKTLIEFFDHIFAG